MSNTALAEPESDTGADEQGGIVYLQTKDFVRSMQRAMAQGGQNRKRRDKVKIVLGSLEDPDPFTTLQVTNHGERRIRHCVKYDLGDGWRLVTQQNSRQCIFLFMGDHDDVDKWLDGHKGDRIVVDGGTLRTVSGGHAPSPAASGDRRVSLDAGAFLDHFTDDTVDFILDGVPRTTCRRLEGIGPDTPWSEMQALVDEVPDEARRDMLLSVLTNLMNGDVEAARARVDLERGIARDIEEVETGDLMEVKDGDDVRRIRVGSQEYEDWLRDFDRQSEWHDWFLFLHPEQEKVMVADFPGPAQLSGVSGSGKTCVVVRRAIRLAQPEGAKVLLLTLNRSLAGLLRHLVDVACPDPDVRSRIRVISFFSLAQELLSQFEPENRKLYEDVTWKLGEHVDEIFREYYRCWANVEDARVLQPIHRSLNGRGVSGEAYLRDEFDWIRSALFKENRNDYLSIERSRRRFPLPKDWRRLVTEGLEGWERKMAAVGVIDYPGLTSALTRHLGKIWPAYTNILVDEAQDFGTTELAVVRQLVPEGPNDIFLCGDVAQTILPKHQNRADAGFSEVSRVAIRQNYRNSREILNAAHALLTQNLHDEMFDAAGLEILDPKLANFSGSAPVALAADSLEEEIAFARAYVRDQIASGDARNACIAFAGQSMRSVKLFADRCGLTALDGSYDPNTDPVVLSDLEQTKGYEFDVLVIVNCSQGVLPAKDALPEEAFRDACRLYVAMTRAKRELIMSFNGVASPWILAVGDTISIDAWNEVETLERDLLSGTPERLPEVEKIEGSEDEFGLTGRDFLFTSLALDLAPETQDKLVDIVDGKGALMGGNVRRRLRWKTVGQLVDDLMSTRMNDAALVRSSRRICGIAWDLIAND